MYNVYTVTLMLWSFFFLNKPYILRKQQNNNLLLTVAT